MLASTAQIKASNPLHVIRGVQLAFLGVVRALQNPSLYTWQYYRLFAIAIITSIILHVALNIPAFVVRWTVLTGSYIKQDVNWGLSWENQLNASIGFIQHWILSVPVTVISYYRNVDPSTFDTLFLKSMQWVDKIYQNKHAGEPQQDLRELYTTSLEKLDPHYVNTFYTRTVKRIMLGMLIYGASYLPQIGAFVLPAVSCYSLNKAIGVVPSIAIFSIAGLLLTRQHFVIILQIYFSARSLTQQLLQPYWARVGNAFTPYQKAKWYREREGLLFGFSLPFVVLLRIPFIGILIYGIASSSAAFLVSKVTHPPPEDASLLKKYADEEVLWTQGRRNLVKAGVQKVVKQKEDR